jgi:signal transduction histidine kinase
MLHDFLQSNRDGIIARVAASLPPGATSAELRGEVPVFMDQLIDALLRTNGVGAAAIEHSARTHGAALLRAGFSCAQLVHDYGNVCQVITGLACETNAAITPDEFRTLNRCLDDAIAGAITEFSRLREEAIDHVESEHLIGLARELRNPLAAALLTYRVLKSGTVGIGGSTGTELGRNLRRVSALIDRTMARVRLDAAVQSPECLSLFTFIEELEVGAALEANARGLSLSVASLGRGVDVEVDRQLLCAAVSNLVQNALQFTRPGGHIALRTASTADRVSIEVEDECGGLPAGQERELVRAFAQQGSARIALGEGLSIVRRSVEAMRAELRVRDIPGAGCVFTIDLPKQNDGVEATRTPLG